jgi:hypothetical protein
MNEHLHSSDRNYRESAEILNSMQQEANEGRGISAIRDIVLYLERGNVDAAKATISGEWDKISSYPKIAQFLISEGLYTPVDFSEYFDN